MYIRDKRAKSGFTLIELLVVIAIIGILSSVVLASLNTARRKSRDARRVTDIKQIELALQLYSDGVGDGQYPVGDSSATGCVDSDYGLRTLVTSGYIPAVPHDPLDLTACYRYASGEFDSRIATYHLTAVLEDSGHIGLANDDDCSSDGVLSSDDCNAGTLLEGAVWTGAVSNGKDSVDCVAASGVIDQCFDVKP